MLREDLISANIELSASDSSHRFAHLADASRRLVIRPSKELEFES